MSKKRKKGRRTRRTARRRSGPDAQGGPTQPRLSACLIVKDEADCLADCLDSLRGLADDVIVLDTGSSDDTVTIARAAGARVEHMAWPDSFSAARNASLQFATGDWVLVVDADEVIARRDHASVCALLTAPADVMGYILIQRNYTNDQATARWQVTEPGCPEAHGAAGWFPAPIVRLFRRDSRIRFDGEVHEGVDDSIRDAGGRVLAAHIPIHHYGKLRGEARQQAKAELYRRLGERKAARSGSAVARYELGLQYAELGLLAQAERELCAATETDPRLVKAWADLGSVYERGGDAAKAMTAYRRALALDADYLPALVNLGSALATAERTQEAAQAFGRAQALNPDNPVILNNLAAHQAGLGKLDAAEQLYRRAIRINPDYVQAQVNLGNLLEGLGRHADARRQLEATCRRFPSHAPALGALALVCNRLGDWAASQVAGGRAVELFDGDAIVWTNLAVARFEQQDIPGAMAATRRAVDLDPAYAPAARNWEQLAHRFPHIAAELTARTPAVHVESGPRVAFFHQGQPFTGASLRERGLGGTESAVIHMAEALAARGCGVTVFNHCAAPVLEHGVRYQPVAAAAGAMAETPPDVLVAIRSWHGLELVPASTLRVYWAQDAADQPAVQGLADPAVRERIDRYLGISAWQIDGYCRAFGIAPAAWTQTRNGVDAGLFAERPPRRDRHKLVYASTPFRGLDVLLRIFPRIRAAVPTATLDVYSGMGLYGLSAEEDRVRYGALYDQAEQPGVTLHGPVPQLRLARAFLTAGMLAYPNHFAETSCIAALQAQAAGCPVVTSALGALPETVVHGETGLCIPGDAHSPAYQDAFVHAVVELLQDEQRWETWSDTARTRVLDRYPWDRIADEWLELFAAVPA